VSFLVREVLVEAKDEGWVEWDGYPCSGPELSYNLDVEVKHQDGSLKRAKVGDFDWTHWYMESDIVAYRVVEDTSPMPYGDLPNSMPWKATKAWWESAYNENPRWYEEGSHVKENPYKKAFPYDTIDIYRVLQVYEVTDPCIQHAIKKLLCAGKRGYKEVEKDVEEAIQSLQRWEEMRREEQI
jgi:hypothetical protein